MRPFKPGEAFTFPNGPEGKGFVQLDAFEKLGSLVSNDLAEPGKSEEITQHLKIHTSRGSPISAAIKVQLLDMSAEKRLKSQTRHKLALDAKNYLDLYDVWGVIQGMLHTMLKQRPEDPLSFMLEHLTELHRLRESGTRPDAGATAKPAEEPATESAAPPAARSATNDNLQSFVSADVAEFSRLSAATHGRGLGEEEFPGFPADVCPEQLPNLSNHHSIMADVLRNDTSIYDVLRRRCTKNGVPFAKCIKSGIDNPGHPLLKIVGAVAGDSECYTVFKELFDPIIRVRHGGYGPDSLHPTDLSAERVTNARIDPSGRYVISTRVRSSRSLRGLRFPPACDRAERCKVEQILSTALMGFTQPELRGAYFPLRGSTSYAPKPEGMSFEEEAALRRESLLFQEPDSSVLLCSGMGRHWPEARGVFLADSRKLVAWLNEEDHMRIISMQIGDNLREAFLCFAKGLEEIESSLKSQGCAFAHDEHLGYISSCPSNLGTGLRASVVLRLPQLGGTRHIQSICRSLGLQARGGLVPTSNGEELGVWDVSNRERLGVSEVDLVNTVIAGCTKLVALEQALERGEELPSPATL